MKLRKKISLFCISLIAIFLLVACGDDSKESVSNNDGAENESGGESSEEPFEISIMTPLHTAETPDSKIQELIEEKTNVKLDIQWIPATTYADRMNTAFATESLTDIVNIPMEGAFKEAIRDDQFWEIEPYLDEFENLSNLKEEILANTMVDGKLYALYQGRPLSRQGIIYRKDWADNLGLSAPKTTDDFYEMVKQFTENDPDGNGVDDTIGLADREDLNSGAFKTIASWFGTPNEWGEMDGKLMPAFMFPEYKDTMDLFKKLRENGYINLDFPVTSKPDQQGLMINGTAGVYVGCMCDVSSIYNDAVELNPNVEFDVHNSVKGPHGEYGVWSIPGFNHPYLFPKSSVKTEEDLKKILGFLNDLMEPEIANLLNWGIEGEHYTVEDGMAVPVEDSEKIAREVTPYNTIEVGEPDTNGRLVGKFEYPAAEKAEELYKDNENYLVTDPTITLDSDTFDRDGERLTQIMVDATYNYILGEIDEEGYNQAIENWKNEGGEKVIEEYNNSYQD